MGFAKILLAVLILGASASMLIAGYLAFGLPAALGLLGFLQAFAALVILRGLTNGG